LGAERSYKEIVASSIAQSDGVTAVSESLKADTNREFGKTRDIRVIPNFIDVYTSCRTDRTALRASLPSPAERTVIPVSNCRPGERLTAVVAIFNGIPAVMPARLLMVGDGPDLAEGSQRARAAELGVSVRFLGDQEPVVQLLSASDLFLM